MAKKITNTEETEKNIPAGTQTGAQEETGAGEVNEIPPHIAVILKNSLLYDSLYIDSFGGCFTADTPPNIRGSATLYKNPFYKQ